MLDGVRKEGASDERILALLDFRQSDLFSEAEKVALELSEAMTDTPQRVTDDLFREMQKHYSNPQIVELASIIALENLRSRFNRRWSRGTPRLLPHAGRVTGRGRHGARRGLSACLAYAQPNRRSYTCSLS